MTTAEALAPIDNLKAHDDPVNHVVFAQEGLLMATADTAMRVKVWQGREMFNELDMHTLSEKVRPTERIRGLKFSPGADRLFIGAGEKVWAFNLNSGSAEPEWTYTAPRLFAFLVVSPTSISLSKSGILAAAFDNGTIITWDSKGVRQLVIHHNAAPRQLSFIDDDSIIGTDGFSTSLWKPDQRKPIWHRSSKERIYGMAASSDGMFVAIRRLYATTVYRISDGEEVVRHKQGRGLPLVAFGPDTHYLAIGSQHAIDVYDISRNTHGRLPLDDAELISLAFLPDSSQITAGCSDGRLRTWNNPVMRPSVEPEG